MPILGATLCKHFRRVRQDFTEVREIGIVWEVLPQYPHRSMMFYVMYIYNYLCISIHTYVLYDCIPYSVSIRILYHLIPSYTASKEPRERKLRNEVLCMTQFFSGGGWLDGTILAQANPTWICLL